MAEVLLFHAVLGCTDGALSFAEDLRTAGHDVHVPDLFDGRTFGSVDDGMAYVQDELGFDAVLQRGTAVAESLPDALVYAGFSLGVMPAQQLAQTRAGARGAVFMHAAVLPEEFGTPWPAGLPVQIHTMADDALGDVDVARSFGDAVPSAEVFLYPGAGHLFTDRTLVDYDAAASALLRERVLAFLDRLG